MLDDDETRALLAGLLIALVWIGAVVAVAALWPEALIWAVLGSAIGLFLCRDTGGRRD